jgi:hypothetical protein
VVQLSRALRSCVLACSQRTARITAEPSAPIDSIDAIGIFPTRRADPVEVLLRLTAQAVSRAARDLNGQE